MGLFDKLLLDGTTQRVVLWIDAYLSNPYDEGCVHLRPIAINHARGLSGPNPAWKTEDADPEVIALKVIIQTAAWEAANLPSDPFKPEPPASLIDLAEYAVTRLVKIGAISKKSIELVLGSFRDNVAKAETARRKKLYADSGFKG